jgi:hypothetical protein
MDRCAVVTADALCRAVEECNYESGGPKGVQGRTNGSVLRALCVVPQQDLT